MRGPFDGLVFPFTWSSGRACGRAGCWQDPGNVRGAKALSSARAGSVGAPRPAPPPRWAEAFLPGLLRSPSALSCASTGLLVPGFHALVRVEGERGLPDPAPESARPAVVLWSSRDGQTALPPFDSSQSMVRNFRLELNSSRRRANRSPPPAVENVRIPETSQPDLLRPPPFRASTGY